MGVLKEKPWKDKQYRGTQKVGRRTQKIREKELYAEWLALPKHLRKVDGKEIPNDVDFAEHYKVNRSTLHAWKNEDKFRAKVHELRQSLIGNDVADVLENLAKHAKTGNDKGMIQLFLEYANEYKNRREVVNINKDEKGVSHAFDSPEFIEYFSEELSEHPLLLQYAIDPSTLSEAIKDLAGKDKEEVE